MQTIDSLRWFSNVVAQRHIFGSADPGAMTPNFELSRDFCTMHLPQVSSSYVYSFGSYRVNKQTDEQNKTNAAENIQRSSLR